MENDFLPLLGTDYIEFYVGNAKQAAHYYKTAFGFQGIAYAGPETGIKDRASYVVRQNKLTFVFTSALRPEHIIAQEVLNHGDAVKAIALEVEDAVKAWKETTQRGAKSYMEPVVLSDKSGKLGLSGIRLYGDTVHLFIARKKYNGIFMPGYEPWISDYQPESTGILYVDHCVGNVGWNQMDKWVSFYETTMGFKNILTFDDTDISTEYSALMSKVMSNGDGQVKFPINEPAEGKRKSQVEEFLEFFNGEGVQHVALATKNIVGTVTELMRRGIEFLKVPTSYYDELESRVGKIEEDLEPLKNLGILVDRDPDGYLLQIFSKPVQDRPTVFFEIIQRKGAKSFGKGNFKALFEAIEHEQEKRGNL
ncbi:MAG TPA: 4-hydroxyphenylpyruvate dioxygenase [Puia sp.]|jgi:4-hydroxyphenylpyruvate dioxygenase|nr:4-hydroxyphenylpyruvate dioxygenase [Puia sp.]